MRIKKFLSSIENYPFKYAFVLILVWIFLRIFFEGILEGTHRIGYSGFSYRTVLMYFLHFPLFYLSTFLFIGILLSLLLHEDIIKVTKAGALGLGLIIFVPVIDALIYGGCYITYPERLEKYFLHFLNPFVSLLDIGVSDGQRIVIIVICLFAGLYGYMKTTHIMKGFLIFFVVLGAILFCGGITTIIARNVPELVYVPGGILNTDTQKFCGIYMSFFIILFFVYIYLIDHNDFQIFTSSIRVERMAFYGLISLMSFIQAEGFSGKINFRDFFNFLGIFFIFLGSAIGFWALQILNDFFDTDTDSLSRPRNPILKGIKKEYYQNAGFVMFLIAIAISLIFNYYTFLVMFTFMLLGVIYSLPPVRLKRFPFLSTFVLAVAVLLAITFGYAVLHQESGFQKIPQPLIYGILAGATLGFSAKDINDIEGDKKNGVITIPVLFYKNDSIAGRLPFSLIISISFLLFALFIPEVLPGSMLFSLFTFFYTLVKKKPEEFFYFLILYIYSVYLFISLCF
ncbi:MAG: UbiA family prenyltransferase [candidate division WOR-3 bacterium]|nr:UbiA family prenyltransferase [candidate division WOR-3 bacterium]